VRARTWALIAGAVLGLGVGRQLAVRRRRSHARELFHSRPPVRYRALSWIARHPSRRALDLLQRYVDWEPIPMLQRRGVVVLGRMSALMGRGDAA
jgi:hypothetical protein